jgi:hypothetical protein
MEKKSWGFVYEEEETRVWFYVEEEGKIYQQTLLLLLQLSLQLFV